MTSQPYEDAWARLFDQLDAIEALVIDPETTREEH